MSIKRLCTRSSHRSHVAVPSPSGDFLVGTTILRVGRGNGSRDLDADPLRYARDLLADLVELFRVSARKPYARLLQCYPSPYLKERG